MINVELFRIHEFGNIEYAPYILRDGFVISLQILDGEATDRTHAINWDLFRDPQGALVNYNVTFGSRLEQDNMLTNLWNTMVSLGEHEFITITARVPGKLITQRMYAAAQPLPLGRISRGGEFYYNSWQINFIAEQGGHV